ncbi:hypothetical protein [Amycolatopsis sacchari]|uniref:hypothetical protein n=1 Tax=Amycolatopsis sacchari TaxID=115433 RepID=UPI003D72D27E
MSRKSAPLPPPNMSGTDTDEVLRRRISVGPEQPPPAPTPTPPTPAHTQVNTRETKVREKSKGTRPDPAGMRRTSLYITKEAAEKLEAAADQVLAKLGGDTPRYVALSALLLAGVEQAPVVTRRLAEQQAAELAARLAALQQEEASGK